jgi:hypothetical protein
LENESECKRKELSVRRMVGRKREEEGVSEKG